MFNTNLAAMSLGAMMAPRVSVSAVGGLKGTSLVGVTGRALLKMYLLASSLREVCPPPRLLLLFFRLLLGVPGSRLVVFLMMVTLSQYLVL